MLRVFVADAAAAVVSVLVCCPLLFGLFLVAVGAWRSGAWGFGMWRSALGVGDDTVVVVFMFSQLFSCCCCFFIVLAVVAVALC